MTKRALQLVQIDIDQCVNDYGTSPCTASGSAGSECFRYYRHCQDVANFEGAAQTLTFSKGQTGIFGQLIFPALVSVSTNPTRISLSQTDDRLGSLGKRARITVEFTDFKWGGTTDPYAATRAYDANQGTFFGKLRARFPYYYGRSLRVLEGEYGDDPSTMRTRHYIITEWSGPDSSGRVQITAQDPIRLADDQLSQCPLPTSGELTAPLGAGLGAFTLQPAGVGDEEYDASGYVQINGEIIGFTRTGDTVTMTERGAGGTEAKSHAEGDAVQQCYSVSDANPADVIFALLNTFAGIPADVLDYDGWVTELTLWLAAARFTRIVPEPTPVKDLLGEMTVHGMFIWHDPRENLVKIRMNRPPDLNAVVPLVTDAANIIERATTLEDKNDQRLTRVRVHHGLIDQTGNLEDVKNYRRENSAYDLGKESENEYAQKRTLDIYLPWVAADDSLANALALRTLNRFRNTPRALTFPVDAKDVESITVGQLIDVMSRTIQDETGAPETVRMQVLSEHEVVPNHRVDVAAQEFVFIGRFGFITEDGRVDYSSSTPAQIAGGTYIVGPSLTFPDGTGPYQIF